MDKIYETSKIWQDKETGIYFCIIFDHYYHSFISGRETGY